MAKSLVDNLNRLNDKALAELEKVNQPGALEEWRVKYLGRKGELPFLLRSVGGLPEGERREAGSSGNRIRRELEFSFEEKRSSLGFVPVIRSDIKPRIMQEERGHLNPLTKAIRRITKIFTDMGFILAEGPLAEDPAYAFDLLNIPLEHPARGIMDTFYLEGGQVLRPHTSPVQLRAVLENNLKPPFKVFSPGRVFRAERTDASHHYTFHQVEALMVGEDVTIGDFKGVVARYFSEFFNRPATIRLRPSYFPFVEPGFEVDMNCIFCQGKGCSVCQRSGWMEMMGAGMVHPNVLKNMNVDPTRFQGFAFGGGIERMAMLLYGVDDIRLFLSGDLRFVKQF